MAFFYNKKQQETKNKNNVKLKNKIYKPLYVLF